LCDRGVRQFRERVKVVGAGSFAVTKKSPFAMDAFVDSRRYLVNQAKCVIFVGPAMDDDGNLHPIAENVDRVVLVRMGARFDARTIDPLEEKVASVQTAESWSVRINTRTAAPAARKPQETAKAEPTLVAEVEDLVDRLSEPRPAPRPAATRMASDRVPVEEETGFADAPSAGGEGPLFEEEEELAGPHIRRKSVGTRIIRVVISFVVLVLVAFVVWWLYLTRSVREHGGERAGAVRRTPVTAPPAPVTATDSLRSGRSIEPPPVTTEETAPAERTASGEAAGRGETTKSAAETAAALKPQTTVSTPDSIHFAATLDEFANQYVVHAGSFRGVDKAKEEAFYLLGWGYSVFIYRVDLESKGVWYRVYVGPFATREDAMERKIKLDENPRIRSTRVSKVPG
jgi:cell division protein FtsN